MGWGGQGEEDGPPTRMIEPLMWLGCLLASVIPSAGIVALTRWLAGEVTPVCGLVIYVAVFSLMVVAIRPWSVR